MKYVIKLGGHSLNDLSPASEMVRWLCEDLRLLLDNGDFVCVIHGGGPQIDAELALAGISSEFVEGLRVTSLDAAMRTEMALSSVNAALVLALNSAGIRGVGLRGLDGNQVVGRPAGSPWGSVAQSPHVNPSLIEVLWASGYLPVISPITSDGKGQLLNCNADELAGSVSRALGADALFLLSDIDQIRLDVLDAATGLAKISFDDLEAMVNDGRASGGMIPKAKAAIAAGRHGAARVVIANAATKNILTKALTNQALTTEVIA